MWTEEDASPLRILVVGDTASGKSSMLKLICDGFDEALPVLPATGTPHHPDDAAAGRSRKRGKDRARGREGTFMLGDGDGAGWSSESAGFATQAASQSHPSHQGCPAPASNSLFRIRGIRSSGRAATAQVCRTTGCDIHVALCRFPEPCLRSSSSSSANDARQGCGPHGEGAAARGGGGGGVWKAVEFWDVSGDRNFSLCRSLFYCNNFDAVMLVYDVSKAASSRRDPFDSLSSWLLELCTRQVPPSSLLFSPTESQSTSRNPLKRAVRYDLDGDSEDPHCGPRVLSEAAPIVCVATKADDALAAARKQTQQHRAYRQTLHTQQQQQQQQSSSTVASSGDEGRRTAGLTGSLLSFLFSRLFGGVTGFVDRLWDSRVDSSQAAAARTRVRLLLAKAPHIFTSFKNQRIQRRPLVAFLLQAYAAQLRQRCNSSCSGGRLSEV
eukprot:GHVU01147162.1.p1 GENE.GHVU01147162.1~~GHVU01147162.1.p1  ORF type:complete len:440 (-),score=73.68 GHVU01147162.1:553-1872(-)